MDADLPIPDRVDLDPYEVEDDVIAPDDEEQVAVAEGAPVAEAAPDGAAEAVAEGAGVAEAEPDAADGRLDLDAIEADLAGVEVALARLSDGTYWTDEATGEPLPDEFLASSPTARRA